jgi:hypothetical protein
MRIKGSDLKRIIKEEISRSIRLNEADGDMAPRIDFEEESMLGKIEATTERVESSLTVRLVNAILKDPPQGAPEGNPIKNISEGDEISVTGMVYTKMIDMKGSMLYKPDDLEYRLMIAPFVDTMTINGSPVSTEDISAAGLRRSPGFDSSFALKGTYNASFAVYDDLASLNVTAASRLLKDAISGNLRFNQSS